MDKSFLIDGRLVFHSGRNELVSQNRQEIKEILNTPCARCLEVLLSAPGQIVSQTELYKAGWGEGWKEVSPNTLYQNILLARKALRNVSESDDDFIITVPRKGFRFNENIPVTESALSPEAESQQAAAISKEDSVSAGRPLTYTLSRLLIPATCLFVILAVAIFTLGIYRFDNTYHDDFSDDYIYFETRSECDIHLSKQVALSSTEIEKLLNLWPAITSDCSGFPLRYVTPYRNRLSVFYLSCDSKDKAKRICRSSYLRLSK